MTAYFIVNGLSCRSIHPGPYYNMLDKNMDKMCERWLKAWHF